MVRDQSLPGNPTFRPLTPDVWDAFERLFGSNGACGGCWCMLWRLGRREFDQQKGDGNRAALRTLVEGGVTPGILAFSGTDAIGWCAVAPRNDYPALARSRVLKPVDSQPVWSVSCLFIARAHRRQGVSVRLLRAAVNHVARQGGRIVEGYPVEPKTTDMAPAFAWTGTASAFLKAGFHEVARNSDTRPIMRFEIAGEHQS